MLSPILVNLNATRFYLKKCVFFFFFPFLSLQGEGNRVSDSLESNTRLLELWVQANMRLEHVPNEVGGIGVFYGALYWSRSVVHLAI